MPGPAACRPTGRSTSTAIDVDRIGRKRSVIRALDWTGEFFGNHEKFAHIALDEVADVADPRILELGAGHGGLSRKLLDMASDRAAHRHRRRTRLGGRDRRGRSGRRIPRATVREMDATDIDAPDGQFDLAVFALSFHHLPPPLASRVFAEGTRVADKLLIIDLPRPPAPLHLLRLATMLPFAPFVPFVHDGVISSLRAYSPSALRALAAHADPAIESNCAAGLISPQVAVASRRLGSHCVGEEVKQTEYSRAHRREYRRKVQLCLDVFETMLAQSSFEFDRPMTGMEIECNLVDADYQPAMSNQRGARVDRRPRVPNRIGRLQHRIQRSAAAVARASRLWSSKPRCAPA